MPVYPYTFSGKLPARERQQQLSGADGSRISAPLPGHDVSMGSGVPVQYFQSIIAIELAVTGALLFQVRFFDTSNTKTGPQVDPRLRLVVVLVIAATFFVSLEAGPVCQHDEVACADAGRGGCWWFVPFAGSV